MRVLALTLACSLCAGCADSSRGMVTLSTKGEVEIAPGEWLTLEGETQLHASDVVGPRKDPHQLGPRELLRQLAASGGSSSGGKEEVALEFEWKGQTVKWRRKETIPITLREHEDTLYMVGFNRANMNAIQLVFYKLNAKGTRFEEIKPGQFPRQIATQNMWLPRSARYVSVGGYPEPVDTWELLRKLDIEHIAFSRRYTAQMWYLLETGLEYHVVSKKTIDTAFLREYVRKYQPIPLPTIVREPEERDPSLGEKRIEDSAGGD